MHHRSMEIQLLPTRSANSHRLSIARGRWKQAAISPRTKDFVNYRLISLTSWRLWITHQSGFSCQREQDQGRTLKLSIRKVFDSYLSVEANENYWSEAGHKCGTPSWKFYRNSVRGSGSRWRKPHVITLNAKGAYSFILPLNSASFGGKDRDRQRLHFLQVTKILTDSKSSYWF